jgi:DNA (cytosine-5)-methyltransferase 1
MTRPLLLDLYCGAGGAAVGYHRAGFDIIGVDINPQPHYPFKFHQADALEYLGTATRFDAIHASPPCQDHSPLSALVGKHGTGWLLNATLELLRQQPQPWVVENVMSAKFGADIRLCGEMFGLRTYRHRQFLIDPRQPMLIQLPYHPRHRTRTSMKKIRRDFDAGMHISMTGDLPAWAGPACMDIDWMTGKELAQAIPPAYTHYIGTQLMAIIEAGAA